jgi:hypothetical protein
MEARDSFETSVNFYRTTRYYVTEDSSLHSYPREEFKPLRGDRNVKFIGVFSPLESEAHNNTREYIIIVPTNAYKYI